MDSNVWGPGAWLFLHSITMTYPEHAGELEKQFYKNFFKNLGNVLPCPKCKIHYNDNLKDFPIEPHLNSRRQLVEWLINMHNKVNILLDKPTHGYDEVMQLYYKKYYKNDNIDDFVKKHREWFTKEKVLLYIVIFVLIILLLVRYQKAISNYLKGTFQTTKKPAYY
jgi:hypothetical protein